METAPARQPVAPLTEGHYTAVGLTNHLQMAYDWFAVREPEDGLLIESKHTLYGGSLPPQLARFELDRDWTPRRLEVTAGEMLSASVIFNDEETVMVIKNEQGEQQMRTAVGRRRAFFLLNGGLYFPLHLVRRFQFENPQPQVFALIPEGICEVRRLPDFTEAAGARRQLEVKLMISGVEDVLHLFINDSDDLVQYKTRNFLVKLEERT